jgi:cytochrome c oxidase subunit 4
MSEHVVPIRVYVVIFAALLVGTAATVWIAFIDLGPINTLVALGIAFTKATLVVLYFMHVRYGQPLTWIAVAGGVGWLAILIAFTLADFYSRGWLTPGAL